MYFFSRTDKYKKREKKDNEDPFPKQTKRNKIWKIPSKFGRKREVNMYLNILLIKQMIHC